MKLVSKQVYSTIFSYGKERVTTQMANYTVTINGAVLEITDEDNCNTLTELVALLRDSQNIPANPVALIDGEPVDDFDSEIPEDAEVALNKPAGQKG